MSLQNPTQKMSKSDPNPRSRVLLTDTPDEITKKIMSALTDSTNAVSYDPENRPGVANLLELLSVFDKAGRSPTALADELKGANLRDLKTQAAATVVQGLAGMRERFLDVLSRNGGRYLDEVEAEGAEKANANAQVTMNIVRSAVGF